MEVNGVTFLEEDAVSTIRIVPGKPQGILAWLVKNKVAKNGHQAELQLLAVAIVSVVVAAGIFIYNSVSVQHIPTASKGTLGPAQPTPVRPR